MEWAELIGLCGDGDAKREFLGVFKKFQEGIGYKFCAYIVAQNRYEYLDGTVRRYMPKSQKEASLN